MRSIRPARLSEIVGAVRKFVDPVRMYWPGDLDLSRRFFEREDQWVAAPLDLVDDGGYPERVEKQRRVVTGRGEIFLPVESCRSGANRVSEQLRERGLADLAGTLNGHTSKGGKRLDHGFLRPPGNETRCRDAIQPSCQSAFCRESNQQIVAALICILSTVRL
jgi:hypothetical protein